MPCAAATLFRTLVENLTQQDHFLVRADYAEYVARQTRVAAAWEDSARWTRMSILNTARSGKFSSDRAIREYGERIWHLGPIK
jgi:starch phosphorylase